MFPTGWTRRHPGFDGKNPCGPDVLCLAGNIGPRKLVDVQKVVGDPHDDLGSSAEGVGTVDPSMPLGAAAY